MRFLPFILLLTGCLPASAQRYRRLHRDAIVVDTHNDVLSTVTLRGLRIEDDLSGRTHSDLARFRKGGIDIQVFSIFCDGSFGKDTAFRFANIEIDSLQAIAARNSGRLVMVTDPAALRAAVREGRMGCMIGVEGGHMIEDRLDYLEALYRRGARYLTLTWNNSTSWATSAWDETKNPGLPHKGLTDFGRQVVQKMNDLGMIVDLSHVGEQTFWDAIRTTTKPVIASHSCAYALCPVPRNLKDDQIRAIGANGGVVQLNFYSGFLDSNYNRRKAAFVASHKPQADSLLALQWKASDIEEWLLAHHPTEANALRPPLPLLLDHLDHIVKLAGVDHVGIGSDFDGIESTPLGLYDVAQLPLFTKALLERGYNKKDIRKILGGNFIRVFEANQR